MADDRDKKIWRIIRVVEEEFEVEAKTKDEALSLVQNPYSVKVLKEDIYSK